MMSGTSFGRARQTIARDRGTATTVAIATALLLLGVWTGWAFLARVTRYELSDSARLEIDSAAYPIQSNTAGTVTAVCLRLGQQVRAGDVLLAFDEEGQRLALEEQRTRLATLAPQLSALQAEVSSQDAGQQDERTVLQVAQTGAQAQLSQAEAEATLAEQEWQRSDRMRAEHLISEAEAARAKTAAESKRAAADTLRAAASRLKPELEVRQRDREIKTEQTRMDIAKLRADIATTAATVRKMEYERERRLLRAPISGRLAECAPLRPGSHLAEGDKIGVILPAGKLQVIAQFQPKAALGKVRPGQTAVLRLQGFPWAQYGIVSTRVSRVADEIRDGKVRVELAVNQQIPPQIPAQHGLPGSVEVEIERVSPATLILRSAGEMVGAR